LAASVRLSFKESNLFIFTGSGRRSQKFCNALKKNFRVLSLMRLLFFKMKQDLLCIRVWAEDGPKGEYDCVFPLIANTIRDSISSAGLLLFWDDKA
jgi:hypothetical protein